MKDKIRERLLTISYPCLCSVSHPVEDLERNDGSAERPYLMPESLLQVLKKKNLAQGK